MKKNNDLMAVLAIVLILIIIGTIVFVATRSMMSSPVSQPVNVGPVTEGSSNPGGVSGFNPGGPMIPANGTTSPQADASTTVTLANNNQTIRIPVGQRFLLQLGDQQWSVSVTDPSVIGRVGDISVTGGIQGVYQALKIGNTTLTAQGRPFCPTGQACPQYIIGFSVTVDVVSQ